MQSVPRVRQNKCSCPDSILNFAWCLAPLLASLLPAVRPRCLCLQWAEVQRAKHPVHARQLGRGGCVAGRWLDGGMLRVQQHAGGFSWLWCAEPTQA